ncbi:MAG: H-NS histone family protein [Casimicrobiaceae bacterium]|nr:H-NS histone family protein [Casimicrobiaceae bacterium]MDW8312597.1 H-NS histone family protein [Burkholderiales bacterium]
MSEYLQIQAQIAQLQKKAEALRKAERQAAIRNINELIATFGITASELNFAHADAAERPGRRGRKGRGKGQAVAKSRRKHPSAGRKVPPKYADGKGNTWAGRGQKPKWLVEALNAGATLEQFLITPPAASQQG